MTAKQKVSELKSIGYQVLDNTDPHRIIMGRGSVYAKIERVLPAIRNKEEAYLSTLGNYPESYFEGNNSQVLFCSERYHWGTI